MAHLAAPNAIIIPRVWHLDDGRSDSNPGGVYTEINKNPYRTGQLHAVTILDKVQVWRELAHKRNIRFPPQDQICVAGANEPNHSCDYPTIANYALGFANVCENRWQKLAALLLLGHGHPATPPPNLVSWGDFQKLQPMLTRTEQGG
jgi:hypothetical protein